MMENWDNGSPDPDIGRFQCAGRAKAMPRKRRHTFSITADDGVWLFVSGKQPIEIDAWSH
jgi:hypothetical protein